MNRDLEFRPVRLPGHGHNREVKRLRGVYPLLLLGFWLVGCGEHPLADLTILGVEVVQVASVGADAPRPAARRNATLRVRLETNSSDNVTGVAGSQSGWVGGVIAAPDRASDRAAVSAPVTVFSARERTLEPGEERVALRVTRRLWP